MKNTASHNFRIVTFSPLHLRHTGLAMATSHAGGIPIFNLESCTPEYLEKAMENLQDFLGKLPEGRKFGFRLAATAIDSYRDLLDIACTHPHILLLGNLGLQEKNKLPALLKKEKKWLNAGDRNIWAEVIHENQLQVLEQTKTSFEALVVKGRENAGKLGKESTFVLSQNVIQKTELPVYIQGGIGPHTAAACRAFGAMGVVLEEQLLLMPQSPLPHEWISFLHSIKGDESKIEIREEGEVRILKRANLPADFNLPLGQTSSFMLRFKEEFKTTGKLIQGILEKSQEALDAAIKAQSLAPDSPIAEYHGTKFPIVQGPMTRVSDNPEFVKIVAKNGALPMLAIALKQGPEVKEMLSQTQAIIGDMSWGVGILGFLEKELREAQLAEIYKAAPPFAILSGGNASLVAALEEKKTETYLHAATGELLRIFLRNGLRKFVFEGSEGGGHIGPTGSFVLWEEVIHVLLRELPDAEIANLKLLFAGGIHDDTSAAVIAAMTGTLAAKGAQIGVVMGTAYLFTDEILDTETVLPMFQELAIGCKDTSVIEYALGRQIRCVDSPIVSHFNQVKKEGQEANISSEESFTQLSNIIKGKLRVAAKGMDRNAEGEVVELSEAEQYKNGLYMIGEVAGMHNTTLTLNELHERVSIGGSAKLAAFKKTSSPIQKEAKPSQIAIVGMSAFLPKALSKEAFWENLIKMKSGITEVPIDRWDTRLYYDEDVHAPDKSLSKWGGFLDELAFNPMQFGIPPNALKSTSPGQLLTLQAVQRVLEDAGLTDPNFDHENTSIIIGTEGGSHVKTSFIVRTFLPMLLQGLEADDFDTMPEWSEETFAGILSNVQAGRVANRFDFSGANYVVDSACASSLTAIDLGIKELEYGNSDMVIVGGADLETTPFGFVAFSKSRAMSPTGESLPFDENRNGIVISEGMGMVVIKRLEDAERDGDRIYAVLQGTGLSSDGKGSGLTAPQTKGQEIAFKRAYQKAGYSPATLGFYEAHATGTPVGDKVEMTSLHKVLNDNGATRNTCAVGSAKNIVGHTKTCAGIIGVIKGALALYYQTLPPQQIKSSPLSLLSDKDAPAYILGQAAPWFPAAEFPRRLGVSAFGFGGTNAHVAMEEYTKSFVAAPPGGKTWPFELFKFSADSVSGLQAQIEKVITGFEVAGEISVQELAYWLAKEAEKNAAGNVRHSFVADNIENLVAQLKTALQKLSGDDNVSLPQGSAFSIEAESKSGELAFIFPGQGSQYVNMAREAALYLPKMRESLALTNQNIEGQWPDLFTRNIYPPTAWTDSEKEAQGKQLTATENAQPAIGAVSLGYFKTLQSLGIEPEKVCGHSYGEFSSLMAAGVISEEDFIQLSRFRGEVMSQDCGVDGTMAVVKAPEEEVKAALKSDKVFIANYNSPHQTVISGERVALEKTADELREAGMRVNLIDVAGPFHTPYFDSAQAPLSEKIDAISFSSPKVPVYSNTTAEPYSQDTGEIKDTLKQHLLSPVRFMQQIRQMYADGSRVFVEVGPKSVMSGLIRQVLKGQNHKAISMEGNGNQIRSLLIAIGELFVSGYNPISSRLIENRIESPWLINKKHLFSPEAPLPAMTHFIGGNFIRPMNQEEALWGKKPNVTLETMHKKRIPTIETSNATYAQEIPSSNGNAAVNPNPQPIRNQGSNAMLEGYIAYQNTMQEFLKTQERVLEQFLGRGAPMAHMDEALAPQTLAREVEHVPTPQIQVQTAPPVSTPEPVQEIALVTPATPAISKESITNTILDLLSSRTGYPVEMIGLDQDLEGELGVDSIKRIEVLDKVIEVLPKDWEANLQEHISTLMAFKSISEMIKLIFSDDIKPDNIADAPPAAPPAQVNNANAETLAPKLSNGSVSQNGAQKKTGEIELPAIAEKSTQVEANPEALPRFVFKPEPKQHRMPEDFRLEGNYLLTEDNLGIAKRVRKLIHDLGGKTILIPEKTLRSQSDIEKTLTGVLAEHGSIRGILHLAPLSDIPMPEDLTGWREITQSQSMSLFQIIRFFGLKEESGDHSGLTQILGASSFDGLFGRDNFSNKSLCLPSGGSHAGILRTVMKEWPDINCRVVDFDHTLTLGEIAKRVVNELSCLDGPIDIGYPDGERMAFQLREAPIDKSADQPQALKMGEDWVILVMGGAKGITAEICKYMAMLGMKLILAGRSKSFDPTQKLEFDNGVNKTYQELIDEGVQVTYHSVDVRDEGQMKSLLNGIYEEHGRLDAVFSGVGVIDDMRFTKKKLDAFGKVYDTKVDSAFLLSRYLRPESLKVLVFFGSITGSFGNTGQTDYSAANEVVSRFAWYLRGKWPETRVLTINWGPWDSIGMAVVSPIITKLIKAQGMVPIDPMAGCRYFKDEIEYGGSAGEIVAGEGYWRNLKVNSNRTELVDFFADLGKEAFSLDSNVFNS